GLGRGPRPAQRGVRGHLGGPAAQHTMAVKAVDRLSGLFDGLGHAGQLGEHGQRVLHRARLYPCRAPSPWSGPASDPAPPRRGARAAPPRIRPPFTAENGYGPAPVTVHRCLLTVDRKLRAPRSPPAASFLYFGNPPLVGGGQGARRGIDLSGALS